MLSTSKPLASLSSTLLARKGTAKPAMRPQGFGGFGAMQNAQDDLGWNDMGEEPVPVPPVLVQREALAEEFAPPEPVALEFEPLAVEPEPVSAEPEPIAAAPLPKPISLATAARIGRDTRARHTAKHAKSAFTLRLDGDRHLQLRLASALQNRSAQLLVTEALDAFLATLPDVGALIDQLPVRAKR